MGNCFGSRKVRSKAAEGTGGLVLFPRCYITLVLQGFRRPIPFLYEVMQYVRVNCSYITFAVFRVEEAVKALPLRVRIPSSSSRASVLLLLILLYIMIFFCGNC